MLWVLRKWFEFVQGVLKKPSVQETDRNRVDTETRGKPVLRMKIVNSYRFCIYNRPGCQRLVLEGVFHRIYKGGKLSGPRGEAEAPPYYSHLEGGTLMESLIWDSYCRVCSMLTQSTVLVTYPDSGLRMRHHRTTTGANIK